MSCRSYADISRNELNQLRADLKDKGVDLPPGDDVTLDDAPYGILFKARYQEGGQKLTICIDNVPWIVGEDRVWSMIEAIVLPYTRPDSL